MCLENYFCKYIKKCDFVLSFVFLLLNLCDFFRSMVKSIQLNHPEYIEVNTQGKGFCYINQGLTL